MSFVCCGCNLESDYGTAVVSGDGTHESPFSVTQTDPSFKRPMVRVNRTNSLTIAASGVPTAVTWETEIFDTDAMWAIGQPSRLVVPLQGIYLMGATVTWGQLSSSREIFFMVNGATELERKTIHNTLAFNGGCSFQYLWYLNAGDYVELYAAQYSGGTFPLSTNPCAAWMMYLGKKV